MKVDEWMVGGREDWEAGEGWRETGRMEGDMEGGRDGWVDGWA